MGPPRSACSKASTARNPATSLLPFHRRVPPPPARRLGPRARRRNGHHDRRRGGRHLRVVDAPASSPPLKFLFDPHPHDCTVHEQPLDLPQFPGAGYRLLAGPLRTGRLRRGQSGQGRQSIRPVGNALANALLPDSDAAYTTSVVTSASSRTRFPRRTSSSTAKSGRMAPNGYATSRPDSPSPSAAHPILMHSSSTSSSVRRTCGPSPPQQQRSNSQAGAIGDRRAIRPRPSRASPVRAPRRPRDRPHPAGTAKPTWNAPWLNRARHPTSQRCWSRSYPPWRPGSPSMARSSSVLRIIGRTAAAATPSNDGTIKRPSSPRRFTSCGCSTGPMWPPPRSRPSPTASRRDGRRPPGDAGAENGNLAAHHFTAMIHHTDEEVDGKVLAAARPHRPALQSRRTPRTGTPVGKGRRGGSSGKRSRKHIGSRRPKSAVILMFYSFTI